MFNGLDPAPAAPTASPATEYHITCHVTVTVNSPRGSRRIHIAGSSLVAGGAQTLSRERISSENPRCLHATECSLAESITGFRGHLQCDAHTECRRGAIDPLYVPEVLDEATFLEATETLSPSEAQQAFLVHAYEQYAADYELMRQQRQPLLDEASTRMAGYPQPEGLIDAGREWRACIQQCAAIDEQLWATCSSVLTEMQVGRVDAIALARAAELWYSAAGQEGIEEASIDITKLLAEYPKVQEAMGETVIAYTRTRVALLRTRAFAYADALHTLGTTLRDAGITTETTRNARTDRDAAQAIIDVMLDASVKAVEVSFKQSTRLAEMNHRYMVTIHDVVDPSMFGPFEQAYWQQAFPEMYARACGDRDDAEDLLDELVGDRHAKLAEHVRQFDAAMRHARREAHPGIRAYQRAPKVRNNKAEPPIEEAHTQVLTELHARLDEACAALSKAIEHARGGDDAGA